MKIYSISFLGWVHNWVKEQWKVAFKNVEGIASNNSNFNVGRHIILKLYHVWQCPQTFPIAFSLKDSSKIRSKKHAWSNCIKECPELALSLSPHLVLKYKFKEFFATQEGLWFNLKCEKTYDQWNSRRNVSNHYNYWGKKGMKAKQTSFKRSKAM